MERPQVAGNMGISTPKRFAETCPACSPMGNNPGGLRHSTFVGIAPLRCPEKSAASHGWMQEVSRDVPIV